MKMIKAVLFLSVLVAVIGAPSGDNTRSLSGGLEVIKRLGESRTGEVKVTQGRPRQGESPIYYIRLPPSAYYFSHNTIPSPTVHLPHHKVSVDFINNGKPHKVYHWNLPLYNSPIYRPSPQLPPSLSTTYVTQTSITTQPSTTSPSSQLLTTSSNLSSVTPEPPTTMAEFPTTMPQPSTTKLQALITTTMKPSKRPWLTLKKNFVYNGKPSKVYIWTPRSSPVTGNTNRRARLPTF
ncbi:mucin-2-like [Homarus americanus]|uniref:mucin-2-like n=1 Tax=Homarus americanus TaxID=6706 RepID=UPI001C461A7D|nr:mucin-2-like [Homarus americanus]XP_042207324.1 mucin-2-like [Homarus americanus]